MKINKKMFRRTIGLALVAFASSLLGYFWQINYSSETISDFVILILLMVVGALLSSVG